MIKKLKGILKNLTLPDWKEADEIVSHVWLGSLTDTKDAQMRKVTEVICISRVPHADLQREGFKEAPDLDSNIFTLESDTKGALLPIFGEVCNAIDKTLQEEQGVLVWDVGGGVAALAAYNITQVMRRYDVCLPEAMTVITRARLKHVKRTRLPSQRIIDLLHNEYYLRQLEMWRACKYDILKNTIINPTETRENWIIESIREDPKGAGNEDLEPILRSITEKLPQISQQPHRLSTIAEVEEEVRRLSAGPGVPFWMPATGP